MRRINSEVKRAMRAWLREKYRGHCAYCNKHIGHAGTVDHYLAQALGGTNAKDNLRWSCRPCNEQKADMTPKEWEERAPLMMTRHETPYERKVRLLQQICARNEVI